MSQEAPNEQLEKLRAREEMRRQERIRTAEQYFESGKKSYEARRFEDASREFQAALAANPQHAESKKYLEEIRNIRREAEGADPGR